VGRHRGEGAAEGADGRACRRNNNDLAHGFLLSIACPNFLLNRT
jgi:hypothetical protein